MKHPNESGMELDVEMASLELNEKKRRFSAVGEASAESGEEDSEQSSGTNTNPPLRRSARKRIRPVDIEKRRVYTKPKKIGADGIGDATGYYLNKKVKLVHTNLETIFEEPKSEQDLMSGRKFRRLINFATQSSEKLKTKKRQMKAKKVCSTKFLRSKKITKELVLAKLKELDQAEHT